MERIKSATIKIAAAAFWIIVWEALSRFVGSELIICSPVVAFKRLISLLGTGDFYRAVGFSSIRILSGFFAALVLGTVLAALAEKIRPVKILLSPLTSIIKATPVASFIILAIIWFGSRNLSFFISFLMVLPIIYLNISEGLASRDKDLREMAAVFKMSPARRFRFITLRELSPFLESGCSAALGLCWKSGVAAEVIGISTGSVGERLYRAKLYFETGDLLAWTAVIVLISAGFEAVFMRLLRGLIKRLGEVRYDKA